jgi:hypothetical protein
MRGLIQTYITIGATLGTILAVPLWQETIVGHDWPRSWAEAKPVALPLVLATGHGVLRMYSWLPSAIYYLGVHHTPFREWLFDGW